MAHCEAMREESANSKGWRTTERAVFTLYFAFFARNMAAMTIQPTVQDAMPLDAATFAAVESAQEQRQRGQAINWERVKINVRKQHQAWLNLQREVSPT